MKDALAILIGKGKGKESESKESGSASLPAAKRILEAIKDDDAEALDDALAEHYASCEEESEETDEED